MIDLKKVATYVVAIAVGTTTLFSCMEREETLPHNEISEDVINGLTNLGYSVDGLQLVNKPLSPFTSQNEMVYIVENDLQVPLTQMQALIAEFASENSSPNTEQYRYNNLVTAPRTINVIGYTGGSYALTQKMQTGLLWAINNYNALNLTLNFTVSFSASTAGDIVVYKSSAAGAGGSAGIPSNGVPYKWVAINSGTEAFSTNVVEQVMTHEIGHCIGMAHTDVADPTSPCGGTGSAGVIHIPGTPTGADPLSVFNACFSSSNTGEFSNFDRIALEYLY